MKKVVALALFTMVTVGSNAQPGEEKATRVPVKVNNWGRLSLFFAAEFFEDTRAQLVSLIGEDGFEKVKKYGNLGGWPGAFRYDPSMRKDTAKRRAYEDRLNRLKLYRIARFVYLTEDGTRNDLPYVILSAPYEENKDVSPGTKWEFMYFIFKEKDVQEL